MIVQADVCLCTPTMKSNITKDALHIARPQNWSTVYELAMVCVPNSMQSIFTFVEPEISVPNDGKDLS